jgi:hypothetical protein
MDEKIFFSDKESKTIAELKAIGGINLPVFKDGTKMYKTSLDELLSASPNTVILPYETATYAEINAITQSGKQVIIYYTGVDDDQFWTLSHKNAESSYVFTWLNGNSLVKMTLSSGNVWSEESLDETIEHILDLSILDEENTTFDVVLTANRNNAISFVESSEQTATVAIEIEDDKPYNIQIVGACTLAITGVEWWGDAITDITNKSEINIMNGRAMGVLIDV